MLPGFDALPGFGFGDSVVPSSATATSGVQIGGGGRGGVSTSIPTPVVIAAVGLVAILLLRK